MDDNESETAFAARALERGLAEVTRVLRWASKTGRFGEHGRLLLSVIDAFHVEVCDSDPSRAFHFFPDRRAIVFELRPLVRIIAVAESTAKRIGYAESDHPDRLAQTAVNLYTVHELTHVIQNFPHFASVAGIKTGVGVSGLALLDVSADYVAAQVCAEVEAMVAHDAPESPIWYSNCLTLAYVLGAFGFPANNRAHKLQRFLGLLLGAVLAQGEALRALNRSHLYPAWKPTLPLLGYDPLKSNELNAFVLGSIPGVLLSKAPPVPSRLLRQIWRGIGLADPLESLQQVGQALIIAEVIDEQRLTFVSASPAPAAGAR